MNSKKYIVALLTLFFLSPSLSWSQAAKRQKNQMKRIRQGMKSGELNKKESRRLLKGQKKIQKAKKKMKSDGEFTKAEKFKLNKMQNRQSARIYKQKHDAQKRKKQ